jgi:hypothetical protein
MKYIIEMASDGTIYVPSFMKTEQYKGFASEI